MANERPEPPKASSPTTPVAPLRWRTVAPVLGAAIAMQSAVWLLLFWLFNGLRLGYAFFDLSDIYGTYYPYALKLAHGLAAYRDFFIEYPPLFVPLLRAAGSPYPLNGFVLRFAALMIGFMIAAGAVTAIAAIEKPRSRRPYVVAAVFSALVLALGPISANRYDAVVALVLAFALLFMMRRDWELAGIALGLGFALKITPAVLLPLLLLVAPPRRAVRALAGFAITAVLPFVWVLAMGGQSGARLAQMIGYHLARPLEIESVLALPLWIGHLAGTKVAVGLAAGSQVIQSGPADAIAKFSPLVLVAALGVTLWLVWRRRRAILADPRLIALATLATLLGSLVGSKVLSPQYFVWIVPAVALVAVDRKVLGVMLGVALVMTHVLFPANYMAFAFHQLAGPVALVIARNLLVVAAFGLSLWRLWALPEVASPARD